jgi:hypothetical protein
MPTKRKTAKTPPALKAYVPPQRPDLPDRVAAAAEAASEREMRTVSVSEWIVRAIVEKLDGEAARPAR